MAERKRDEESPGPKVQELILVGGVTKKQVMFIKGGMPLIFDRGPGLPDKLKVGDQLLIDSRTGEINPIPMKDFDLPLVEFTIDEILSPTLVRASSDSRGKSLLIKDPGLDVEVGDVVGVNLSQPIVSKVMPKPKSKADPLSTPVSVEWDEIIGQDQAVGMLKEVAEGFQHEELARFYKRSLPKGVLLSGPPGCGKTMLAKAVATSMSSSSFFSVRGPEQLSMWVGEAERAIRELFMKGKEEFLKTGTKSVIFIDEADAILGHRGSGAMQRGSRSHDTVVTQFLTMMDGISESGCFLILATNRPDSLDPAIVREGRIDVKIPVVRPSPEIGKQIFSSYLSKRPISGDLQALSSFGIDQLFSLPLHKDFTAGHLLSGALCATFAELSAQSAYQRNVQKKGSVRGITHEDIETASRSLFHGMKNLDHSEAFREFKGV